LGLVTMNLSSGVASAADADWPGESESNASMKRRGKDCRGSLLYVEVLHAEQAPATVPRPRGRHPMALEIRVARGHDAI
jgi:hypothetical protein